MEGHPVFIAQHATAICCRRHLEKWHRIPKGSELTAEQREYVVNALKLCTDAGVMIVPTTGRALSCLPYQMAENPSLYRYVISSDAVPALKDEADYVLPSNREDGVACAIEHCIYLCRIDLSFFGRGVYSCLGSVLMKCAGSHGIRISIRIRYCQIIRKT